MRANVERIYDEYERMAVEAMMIRSAYHAKKLRRNDLFKRPRPEDKEKTLDGVKERQRAIMDRLSKFEQFEGKFGKEDDITDG